ncbi:hypothetical protein [Lysobacter fragariae]
MPARLPFCFVILACALWHGDAAAQVRRCVLPSGQAVFTDKQCGDIGAAERLPREQVQAGSGARRLPGGCAHNLQDLVFEMTTAIDSHDANRLAGVYHWVGMSGDTAYQVWTRLDGIASRPLVDIVPITPASHPAPAPEPEPGWTEARPLTPDTDVTSDNAQAPADPGYYPQTTVRRAPVALRVEQTLGSTATPTHTVFALTRYFGCLWVRF